MELDQSKAPYFQALLDYVDSGVLPFHTPGHVQGNGMDLAFREFVGDNICAIDLTPMPGIDDLLQPVAAIKEAQQLAALAYGADNTFFLINGSTSGNQCMMMTAVNPGDKIAVPRNSHKSMLGGLVMSGAHPIYMQPEVDEELHMDHCVTPETVARTLEEHPDIVAVYVVSPTYYGVAADLASIERIVHDAGKLLLVDEAWGPHFHFHPALPLSATQPAPIYASTLRTRCCRPSRNARCCIRRVARVRIDRLEVRAQDVLVDLAESADGRIAGRRAQADGDRRRRLAVANDRAGRRNAPPYQSRSRACIASEKRCRGAKASSTSTLPRSRLR